MVFGKLEPYDVKTSWTIFKEKLLNYLDANDIQDEWQKRAVCLSSLGDEAYEQIRLLVISDNHKKYHYSFEEMLQKLDGHFEEMPNETILRFRFYKRVQKHGEPFANFVAELRELCEGCNFPEQEKMLRDQIVLGVRNENVQTRLFKEHNLNFKKACQIALAEETL